MVSQKIAQHVVTHFLWRFGSEKCWSYGLVDIERACYVC